MSRSASRQRTTKETSIDLSIELDGAGTAAVSTGIPFYDHMLEQLGKHGGLDLRIAATGDLPTHPHHTVKTIRHPHRAALTTHITTTHLPDRWPVRRLPVGSPWRG